MEDVEHAKFRATAQILYDKTYGNDAFEDYVAIAFPGRTARKKRGEQDAQNILAEEVRRGGFKVTPLPQTSLRSKLNKQVTSDSR